MPYIKVLTPEEDQVLYLGTTEEPKVFELKAGIMYNIYFDKKGCLIASEDIDTCFDEEAV